MEHKVIVLLVSLLFFSVFSIDVSANDVLPVEQDTVGWTLALYVSADNNLDEFAMIDINEILNVGVSEDVNVVILLDRSINGDSTIYEIQDDQLVEVQNPFFTEELFMTEPDTLSDFLNWTVDNYPSENLYLDLWGHGSGWRGLLTDRNREMDLVDLSLGLSWHMLHPGSSKISLMGLDMCSMGTLEVAIELAPYADFLLSSEMEILDFGFPYGTMVEAIKNDSSITSSDLGEITAETYIVDWASKAQYSLIMSVIDLTVLSEDFLPEFDTLSTEMYRWTPGLNDAFTDIRDEAEVYQVPRAVDLGHLLSLLETDERFAMFRPLVTNALNAYTSSIVYSNSYDNPDPNDNVHVEHATGLVVYFNWGYSSSEYLGLEFAQQADWDLFTEGLADNDASFNMTIASLGTINGFPTISYTNDGGNRTANLDLFGLDGSVVASANNFVLAEEGTLSTNTIDPQWVRPFLYCEEDGRMSSATFGPLLWASNSRDDIVLDIIALKRADGKIISGVLTPVAGQDTIIEFFLVGNGNETDVTIGLYIDDSLISTDTFFATNDGTIHSYSVELDAGLHEVALSVLPEATLVNFNVDNDNDFLSTRVASSMPVDDFTIHIDFLKHLDEDPYIFVTNERSGQLLFEGYSFDTPSTITIDSGQYLEGDEISVIVWTSQENATGSLMIYSQDVESTLTLDLVGKELDMTPFLILLGTIFVSFMWAMTLVRNNDARRRH